MTGGRSPRRVDMRAGQESALAEAVTHLREGRVLMYPTETVYGIGASATTDGVLALRAVKPRAAGQPFLALVPGADAVGALDWTDAARALARAFWPGALTLVLSDPSGVFPPGVGSAEGAVAVRHSPDPTVGRILEATGTPLLSSSANLPGRPPATSGSEALIVAREMGAGAEVLVLDAGTLPPSAPSTIVDCTGAIPVVLRSGSVPPDRLRCVLPEIHERTTS